MNSNSSDSAFPNPRTNHKAGFFRRWTGILLDLTKIAITPAVSFSAATGYILFAEHIHTDIINPALGVFLLTCGCSALNQVQEAGIDARMQRTKGRPIPSGRLDPYTAVFFAVIFILLGLYFLSSVDRHKTTVLFLGVLAMIWYNGVYTYLKRLTAFAVVPGALVGAIPPVIGWVAAGGYLYDPFILLVAFFFFMWQIPHFWLLLMMRGKEYSQAGLPSPVDLFSQMQLQRITFMWLLATVSAGLIVAVLIGIRAPWNVVLLIYSAWLVVKNVPLLRSEVLSSRIRPAFLQLTFYALIVMILLCLHALT